MRYPKGWKRQLAELAAVIFVVSFLIHIAWLWLVPILPVVLALALLGLLVRLACWWRNRRW